MSVLHDPTETAIESALERLDLETKVSLLAGQDMWTLPAVPDIGLQSLVMSDGPVGVRGTRWSADDPSIALPSPTALAASWDPDLARRAGRLLGQEARRKGVHVLLAPTVNLHRSPLRWPALRVLLRGPAAHRRGSAPDTSAACKSQGVGATVKHFVCNDYGDRADVTASVRMRTSGRCASSTWRRSRPFVRERRRLGR